MHTYVLRLRISIQYSMLMHTRELMDDKKRMCKKKIGVNE